MHAFALLMVQIVDAYATPMAGDKGELNSQNIFNVLDDDKRQAVAIYFESALYGSSSEVSRS